MGRTEEDTVLVEIEEILKTTDRRIQVRLAGEDREIWLPRRVLEYLPGCVLMPTWLARKLRVWARG